MDTAQQNRYYTKRNQGYIKRFGLSFLDREIELGKPTHDGYWYYKSKATMGYCNSPENPYKANADIWIATGKFLYDYKLKGDTLIESDKMGDQGKFIRVYNDNN